MTFSKRITKLRQTVWRFVFLFVVFEFKEKQKQSCWKWLQRRNHLEPKKGNFKKGKKRTRLFKWVLSSTGKITMSKVFLSFFFPKTRFSKQDNTTFHAFEHVAKRKFFFLVHSFIFCQSFASFFFWQNQKSEHLRKKTFESVAFFTEDLLRKRRKKRSTHCFFYCWCQHLFKKPGSFFPFCDLSLVPKQFLRGNHF